MTVFAALVRTAFNRLVIGDGLRQAHPGTTDWYTDGPLRYWAYCTGDRQVLAVVDLRGQHYHSKVYPTVEVYLAGRDALFLTLELTLATLLGGRH